MKLLTLARDLRRRKARERQHLFVVEGVRATEELLRSNLQILGALVAPQLLNAPRGAQLRETLVRNGIEVAEVKELEFASAAETESPQGILVVAEVPERSFKTLPVDKQLRLVVLDAIQDPGNVGTIVRTAAAFGVHGVVALPGTVDLWNAKVVRAAMGAHFHAHAFHASLEELLQYQSESGVAFWGADVGGDALGGIGQPADRLALAFGNEGSGLTAAVRDHLDRSIAIPISEQVESLNVAVSAGILLHAFRLSEPSS
jgi:RNA methyltransferase, TrmH family